MPLPAEYQHLHSVKSPKRTGADIRKAAERTKRRIIAAGIVVAILIICVVGWMVKYVAFDLVL